MKKVLSYIFIITSIFQLNLFSQWGWLPVPSGTSVTINDIRFSGHTGFAVGNNGLILKSTDDGRSWAIQPSGTTANLKSIDFQSYISWIGCIAGSGGTILRSTSSSGPWIAVNSGTTTDLNYVLLGLDTNLVMVSGNTGKIIYSMNRGLNWINFPTPTSMNLYGISQGYNGYIAVGQQGTILTTFGLGINWVTRTSGTVNDLNSITPYTFDYDNFIAAGNNGTLLKTSNAGINWASVPSGTVQDLRSIGEITYISEPAYIRYLYTAGANGTILTSLDSGISWQQQYTSVPGNILNSISFSSINFGFAAGTQGAIIKTLSNHFYIDSKSIDANRISTPYYTSGICNYDDSANGPGFEYPKGTGKYAKFASGLWIGATVNSEIRVATLQYMENEYYPGQTNSSGIPEGRNDSNFRVYKMSYGINNNERQHWPNALLGNSGQGAPVYFDTAANSWKPLDFGLQTMFMSYTDSYTESHTNYWGGKTNPLKADVKQLNFALESPFSMNNTIITQYTIINRSSNVWENAYFTIWSDDDIGESSNDKMGCDSVLQLGFSYNGENIDPVYGSYPPAAGFLLLKGAVYYTGNNNDTIKFCINKVNSYKTGFKDRGMSVYNYSTNGDPEFPDPQTPEETYNLMKGLHIDGSPFYHPSGYATKLVHSGNPVTGSGWNQQGSTDIRMQVTTGPVNLNPGDTQIIVCAQLVGIGNDYLNSIDIIKQYSADVKQYYQSCYTSIPIGIEPLSSNIPVKYILYQNYPNPFNPVTKIKFALPPSPRGDGLGVKVIIYDILGREVQTLVNETMKAGTYEVDFDGTNLGSGVYYYTLQTGNYSQTRKMVLIK